MKIGDKLTHEGITVVLVKEDIEDSCYGCKLYKRDKVCYIEECCIGDIGIFKKIEEDKS